MLQHGTEATGEKEKEVSLTLTSRVSREAPSDDCAQVSEASTGRNKVRNPKELTLELAFVCRSQLGHKALFLCLLHQAVAKADDAVVQVWIDAHAWPVLLDLSICTALSAF